MPLNKFNAVMMLYECQGKYTTKNRKFPPGRRFPETQTGDVLSRTLLLLC